MTDRLNQEVNVNDLVLTSDPKVNTLLRCIVIKINKKTVTVVALPHVEGENGQYCQWNMGTNFTPGKFNGNYWKDKIGWYRDPSTIVKIGHLHCNDEDGKKFSIVEIGDESLWPNEI